MMKPSLYGPRLLVSNASEICLPQRDGTEVDRHFGHEIYIEDGKVSWCGPAEARPAAATDAPVFDAKQRAIVPTLVDSHSHLVWGGERVADFSRRAKGMSYAEIAAEGGGILTTVEGTRNATFEALLGGARGRLLQRASYGIATTEIKSGYGLTAEHELRMLDVVAALRSEGWDVEGTLLAAHAIPKGMDRKAWVKQIVDELIPEVARRGSARFVDAFVEKSAYTLDEARVVFGAARAHGLVPKLHADQITAGGGAELAAEMGAVSADHLENVSNEGLQQMRDAGVTAVLLPGAMVYLGDTAPKLGQRLIEAGVTVAVATDTNPGSSPTQNLPLMATLSVTLMGLNAEQALRAVTLGGAEALGRKDIGNLTPGCRGQFLVLNGTDSRSLVSAFGEPAVAEMVICGS